MSVKSHDIIHIVDIHLRLIFGKFLRSNIGISIDTIKSLVDNIIKMINFRGNIEDISIWLALRCINKTYSKLYNIESTYVNLSLIKTHAIMVNANQESDEFGFVKRYGIPNMFHPAKKIVYYQCIKCYTELNNKTKRERHFNKCNIVTLDANMICNICGLAKSNHPKLSEYHKVCPLDNKMECGYCKHVINPIVYLSYHKYLCAQMHYVQYNTRNMCGSCGKTKNLQLCYKCLSAKYCRSKCQIKDWNIHKNNCAELVKIRYSSYILKFWPSWHIYNNQGETDQSGAQGAQELRDSWNIEINLL
jgi:hypothetical protein